MKMTRDYQTWVKQAVAPFVIAAGEPNYADALKTLGLPDDRQQDQFEKFKTIEAFGGEPLHLPPTGFVSRFRDSRSAFLCISSQGLDDEETEALRDWCLEEGLSEDRLDEATFLFLASQQGAFYRPVGRNLRRDRAENLLNIVGEGYLGHDIMDLILWYQSALIFEIPEDHRFTDSSAYKIAALIVARTDFYRPQIIGTEVAVGIARLLTLPNINPENLYFALTSTHWKHTFLDLYRCMEAIFFLPWAKALRQSLSSRLNALELAKECRKNLAWREREKASIGKLFEMLPEAVCRSTSIQHLPAFTDLFGNVAGQRSFGERIYKVRNQLVHQEDYDDPNPLELPQDCWHPMCLYIIDVLERLYYDNQVDISYTF